MLGPARPHTQFTHVSRHSAEEGVNDAREDMKLLSERRSFDLSVPKCFNTFLKF